jgi:hypothetical protein
LQQNRLSLPVFFFSQSTQAILRLIRTKGHILPDKKGYISSSVLDWYPLLKRTDQTGPGTGGGGRGSFLFPPPPSIPRRVLVLGTFIKELAYQSGKLVLGLKADF